MSVFKKVKSLAKTGLNPAREGRKNFMFPDEEIEKEARRRAEICRNCEHNVEEPISFLRVVDKRIPELSGRMNNECGCPLSYLLRQDIKICEKWQKNTSS